MEYRSMEFPARLAGLAFSMDVPEGFIELPVPREDVDFDNPTLTAPIAVVSSQVAMALVAVSARPVYETGSVLQWIRYLCGHHGMDLQSVIIGAVGKDGCHPAVTAFATQVQNGEKLNFSVAAFEDGGRLVVAHGMCPAQLWNSFGSALTRAVESITLKDPQGPTRDLDSTTAPGWQKSDATSPESCEQYQQEMKEKRKPVVEVAEQLLEHDRFEEAEGAIAAVDRSIQGGVEIARMYERQLRRLVDGGTLKADRDRVERVFRRALSWAQSCYPEPHTEIEARDYESGREEDAARLIQILGYDPR